MDTQETAATADYIIVGGGTAGLVVANRLSEDPDVHVLVLEAGENQLENPMVNIPAMAPALHGSEVDFQYHTIPQPALNGREVKEPAGRMLGGSSGINAEAWIAPSKAGFEAWARVGNVGWDWESVSPYFKKSYTLTPPSDQATLEHLGIDWLDEDHRGRGGPVQVSFPGSVEHPFAKAWVDAFKAQNWATNHDPFSGTSTGGYSSTQSVDPVSKTRSYAATAYGAPALGRSNFQLITNSNVEKLVLEKGLDGVSVTGVQTVVDGQSRMFSARREVVLAAGVYNTPKILELSGIGNASILRGLGIEVVIENSGVGENLQDHLMTVVSYEAADGVATMDPVMRREPEAVAVAQELYARKQGPLTAGGIQSHAFMPVPKFVADPAIYKELLDKHTPNDAQEASYYNVVRSIIESSEEGTAGWFMFPGQFNMREPGAPMMQGHFASLGFSQCHPLSRGSTHISSGDVNAMPEINPGFLSNPIDLEIMAYHVQALESFRHQPEFARLLKPDGRRNHPEAYEIGDLEGARTWVSNTASTTCHGCGTAAMMPRDRGGVVDEKLKVYGTRNLRIVDASIFPFVPRGNTQSTVYAVAEKAADVIKGCR